MDPIGGVNSVGNKEQKCIYKKPAAEAAEASSMVSINIAKALLFFWAFFFGFLSTMAIFVVVIVVN